MYMKRLQIKNWRLIYIFYRGFMIPSMLITIICLFLFRQHGFSIFQALFWFKLITLAITYYYINYYKRKEYYYYYNLGIAKWKLWSTTLTFDFFLFLFLTN